MTDVPMADEDKRFPREVKVLLTSPQMALRFLQLIDDGSTDQTLMSVREDVVALLEPELSLPIEELDLSVRAYNFLKRNDIHTVGNLIYETADTLKETGNRFQRECLAEVEERLHTRTGYSLKLS